MKKLGILTCDRLKDLLSYDVETAKDLTAAGIETVPVVWDKAKPQELEEFDMLLFRSTWDYFTKYPLFLDFLDTVDRHGIKTLNPVETVRWNSDKNYLKEISRRGIELIPSVFIDRYSIFDTDSLDALSGPKVVIKPTVSAGSYETYCIDKSEAIKIAPQINNLLQSSDIIVQKFMPEVSDEGEWSTIFLGTEYRYTVLKSPKAGDYRVQKDFGGHYKYKQSPPACVIEGIEKVRAIMDKPYIYMRVDGIRRGEKFFLMEVEMIEPDLYMDIYPAARGEFMEIISNILL